MSYTKHKKRNNIVPSTTADDRKNTSLEYDRVYISSTVLKNHMKDSICS